jgi:hypothetical protein
MKFQYNDGGRAAAGYKGAARDCACRAIAIATGLPYQAIYDRLNELGKCERTGRRKTGRTTARGGAYSATVRKCMQSLGWRWVPTMKIGQGCRVHLRAGELPAGRLVVVVSKHLLAVIDGVIHDTFEDSRDGTRCVYGYFTKGE